MSARIMVIDDNQDILNLVRLILEHQGFEVIIADTGGQALLTLAETQPDLIICDVRMPDLDGFDTVRAIRRNPTTQDLPVVMLSALGQIKDVQKAMAVGANDYIVKPFAMRELLNRVLRQLPHQEPGRVA